LGTTSDEEDLEAAGPAVEEAEEPVDERPLKTRLRHFLVGPPRSLKDSSLFHHLSLIPFLAWVGLGADGLSSSAYGPEEAFRALGGNTYLAIGLAILTAATVWIIALAYMRIIEKFPHGGGGYTVATKVLGEKAGVVSGCALLVDYVLTVTISIASAGDQLFSVLSNLTGSTDVQSFKFAAEVVFLLGLMLLNLRGVKESVIALAPIFLVFILTHVVMIVGGMIVHVGDAGQRARELSHEFHTGLRTIGWGGMALIFLRAFSLGGGTYTGIEAVSNSMPILREPHVKTGKATMRYMAISLAFVASGLIVCYLLFRVAPDPATDPQGRVTMNFLLAQKFFGSSTFGGLLVAITVLSEAALLIVAAQAGFVDGPRVLANLAVDSWVPRRFSALSERLTTQNGVVLIATASCAALLYTGGDVSKIVVMYSINVFLTFTLSMVAMVRLWWRAPADRPHKRARLALFLTGSLLCSTILGVTIFEKFGEGGWMTLLVTGACVLVCFTIKKHYVEVAQKLSSLYADLANLPLPEATEAREPDPRQPTAVVLVSSYGGLGIHTVYNVFRAFPDHFKNLVFLSIGVIDSGAFKGDQAVPGLERRTKQMLQKYVELGRRLGVPSALRVAIGIDAVETAEKLCLSVAKEFPRATFFAGKVIFKEEGFWQRFLHNETAVALQKRLHFDGLTMVILPARVY
jgi:amino acid transporter